MMMLGYQIHYIVVKIKYIVLWCNGNTLVFGTKVQGSSPCRTADNIKINVDLCGYLREGSYIYGILINKK